MKLTKEDVQIIESIIRVNFYIIRRFGLLGNVMSADDFYSRIEMTRNSYRKLIEGDSLFPIYRGVKPDKENIGYKLCKSRVNMIVVSTGISEDYIIGKKSLWDYIDDSSVEKPNYSEGTYHWLKENKDKINALVKRKFLEYESKTVSDLQQSNVLDCLYYWVKKGSPMEGKDFLLNALDQFLKKITPLDWKECDDMELLKRVNDKLRAISKQAGATYIYKRDVLGIKSIKNNQD